MSWSRTTIVRLSGLNLPYESERVVCKQRVRNPQDKPAGAVYDSHQTHPKRILSPQRDAVRRSASVWPRDSRTAMAPTTKLNGGQQKTLISYVFTSSIELGAQLISCVKLLPKPFLRHDRI